MAGIDASTVLFKESWPTPGKVFEVTAFMPPACADTSSVPWKARVMPPTCGVGGVCNKPNYTCGVNKTRPVHPTAAQITAAVQATVDAAAVGDLMPAFGGPAIADAPTAAGGPID